MDVAFLGLGQMGTGMVGRLIEAGHRVTVWNRDGAKAAPFAARGARVAASPAEAARVGTVMTMLANDAAVEAVVLGEAGLLAAGPGLLHVSCCTSPAARSAPPSRSGWRRRMPKRASASSRRRCWGGPTWRRRDGWR